ncbi:MAG: GDSL-type esterase/lipase family protein [Actinomycetota bacterium]|nr:GDSL-type esterase/lipase family protein [Actinomycetota bacterium]
MAALFVAAIVVNLLKPGPPGPIRLRRPAATACTQHWVGSWAASPSGVSLTQPLANQTVRMIVAPHLAGRSLRLHFTNRHGLAPVTLGAVTVGLRGPNASLVPGSERAALVRGPNASLVPGSERRVTFGGQSSVVIPVGADAVSDPVKLGFDPFQDLAVSVYLPGTVTHPVEHFATRQTSYLSPTGSGDRSAQVGASAFTQTTTGKFSTGWYFLDGVDVLAPGPAGAVIAFGDSLTDGYQARRNGSEQLATIDTNGRYPDDLARRLIAAKIPLSVLNAGIGGDQLLRSGVPTYGLSGLSRFGTDALGQSGVTDVIVLMGINDIALRATASQLIAAYEQLISRAHAAGVAIQLGTLMPSTGTPSPAYGDAAATSVREQVNQWIRTQRFSDGIIDFDAAVRDPRDPSVINPAYNGGDSLHLDLAGYDAMARAVDLASLARPNCIQ